MGPGLTTIISSKHATLNNGINKGNFMHGSCLLNGYMYGSSRNVASGYPTENGVIIKLKDDDVTIFTIFPIVKDALGTKLCQMDSLVAIGTNLYTVAEIGNNVPILIKFDTLTDTYQTYLLPGTLDAYGHPSCTDGTYLYVYLGGYKVYKIDPAVFNSVDQFNVSTVWTLNETIYTYTNYGSANAKPHTMCVDNEYLYVGMGAANSRGAFEIHKILKSNMSHVGYAITPKMTDDMCHNATHLFIGIELFALNDPTSYGYGVGVCAIRKSDMRVTSIPTFHTSLLPMNESFASLIFGNILLDCQTNAYIYAIDISDADDWNITEEAGIRTLMAYRIKKPNGAVLGYPVNELLLNEDGVFSSFIWNTGSYVSDTANFVLTGLNFYSIPEVSSVSYTVISESSALFTGAILKEGGKTITECGIELGRLSDLSDAVLFQGVRDGLEFGTTVEDLETGIYYWRAYAINAEGVGYGRTLRYPYTAPEFPTNVESAQSIEVVLSWNEPADSGGSDITGYKIERKSVGAEWAVIVPNTETSDTTYTDIVAPGNYVYRISTITTYSTGLPSEEFAVTATIGGGSSGDYKIYIGATELSLK